MNLKKLTFKNFKDGILNLSVEQQLKAKMTGLMGGIIGLILALVSFIYAKSWGFSIFIFFLIWLQFIQYIGARQQYIQTKILMEGIRTQQQGIESLEADNKIGNLK